MRTLKYIFALVLLVLCAAMLASCGAKGVERIVDGAGILTEADKSDIKKAISGAGNSDFYVVTCNSAADGFFDGLDFLISRGMSGDDDAVIFVVDVNGGHPTFSACVYGRASDRMPDGYLDLALSEAGRSKSPAAGAVAFIGRVNSGIATPWLMIVMIAILSGVAVGGTVCGIAVARYKMKLRPTNYPLEHYTSSELTDRHDIFINSRISVTTVSTDKK